MQIDDFRLRIEPDPILYSKLKDFDFNAELDLEKIESKMIEIMEKNNGIGISANQVGFDQRVIVIKPKNKDAFAMFNPRILSKDSNETLDQEGCLSFPNLYLPIIRSKKVTVEYVDKHKNICIIELDDIDSKCLQHEIDHLDGIVFTNKISRLKLDLARKKQRKIKNGRT
jgi:peptide deformylase